MAQKDVLAEICRRRRQGKSSRASQFVGAGSARSFPIFSAPTGIFSLNHHSVKDSACTDAYATRKIPKHNLRLQRLGMKNTKETSNRVVGHVRGSLSVNFLEACCYQSYEDEHQSNAVEYFVSWLILGIGKTLPYNRQLDPSILFATNSRSRGVHGY